MDTSLGNVNIRKYVKEISLLFLGALVLYVAGFWLDGWLRTRKGAWEVRFEVRENGSPAMVVSQEYLGIEEMSIVFDGERLGEELADLPRAVRFDSPSKEVPFGELVYDDLMYLPGVATFFCFGHGVELMPRTLVTNRKEAPWVSGGEVVLREEDKVPEFKDGLMGVKELRMLKKRKRD